MVIPEAISNFVDSEEEVKRRIDLMRRFSVPFNTGLIFAKIVNRLYDKEIGLDALIPEIVKATSLPEDTVKGIVLELAGFEFLPVSSYLGDVEAYIRKLGGDPAKYPATRIVLRALAPEEVVSEVLRENVLPVPAHLDSRLREILESFVRGVRSKDDAIHRLTRAEKIGGVGLADTDAVKVMDALDSKAKSVKIDFEPHARTVVAAPEPRPEVGEREATETPRYYGGGGIVSELPLQTNKALAGKGPVMVKPIEGRKEIDIPESVIKFEHELSSAAIRVAGAIAVSVPKELNDRFMSIVVARLKEARKSGETMDALRRPVVAGGMGFSPEVASKTVNLLEAELKKIQSTAAEALKKEKAAFAARQSRETHEREMARREAKEFELDQLYSKLSGKKLEPRPAAKRVMPPPAVPMAAENEEAGKSNPSPAKPPAPSMPMPRPALPSAEEKLLPGPKPAMPNSAPKPAAAPAPAPPGGKPIPVVIEPKNAAPAKPPVPAAPPQFKNPTSKPPSAPEPVLRDIRKVAARLVGPAEELSRMSLDDFRRLSSDPVEACRKLGDKLSLLEEQSYDDRVIGLKAWQDSPLSRLYLSILNESMGGAGSIGMIIRGRETSGKETLTEAEFRAIMEFNRHLKA